uniref:Uncharacterized protein n=1 Tax=Ixodes ricinus TaxID=34613 RepID=A0A6B0UAT1_IXORI
MGIWGLCTRLPAAQKPAVVPSHDRISRMCGVRVCHGQKCLFVLGIYSFYEGLSICSKLWVLEERMPVLLGSKFSFGLYFLWLSDCLFAVGFASESIH